MLALLTQLADGKTHSFEKLTALLSINHEQLFAKINELRTQGLNIEMGFDQAKLIPQTELLSAVKLQQVFVENKVIYQPVIDSTNRFLLENMAQMKKGDICVTEYQSAGRGRRGRQWQSPFASQIIFSFVWQVEAAKPLDGLSSVVGMAIRRALLEQGAKGIMLKWPNDILLNGRKLAGILIEIANSEKGKLNLVVGVGINVALPNNNASIDQPWANLNQILPEIDRTLLLSKIIQQIYQHLERFELYGIDAVFQQDWLDGDEFFGEQVNVITEKQAISGIAQGIDSRGYLTLITEQGDWLYFNSGEVSLRRGCVSNTGLTILGVMSLIGNAPNSGSK